MSAATSVGIALQSVSAAFRSPEGGVVAAVREVDLAVRPGELLTLLGPSGCGKTTVLRIAAGLEAPERGQVVVASRPRPLPVKRGWEAKRTAVAVVRKLPLPPRTSRR